LARDFALFIPLDSLPLVVLCDSTAFARYGKTISIVIE
jgi:hypothetical protein